MRGQEQAEHVQIELFVKMLRRDIFQRLEIVDAGVVHQDIQFVVCLFRFREQLLHFGGPGKIRLDADGLAAVLLDAGHDALGPFFAGAVVNDDRRTFGGELFGDFGADAFGCPGDDGDFASELLSHDETPFEQSLVKQAQIIADKYFQFQ